MSPDANTVTIGTTTEKPDDTTTKSVGVPVMRQHDHHPDTCHDPTDLFASHWRWPTNERDNR